MICAFTSICKEDVCWLPQYLAEADRLLMPFVMHFDRCRDVLQIVKEHPLFMAATFKDSGEFEEWDKQAPFDEIVSRGFKWAMAWDVDETYERDARSKLDEITSLDVDYVDVRWVNLWGDAGHIRTDGPFHPQSGHRVKFYNLNRQRWRFTHKITNGPKVVDDRGEPLDGYPNPTKAREHRHDLTCLHHGMMTPELRALHKERWDRIYTAAVGANPYGFWAYACDETITPIIERNPYL